MAAARAWKPAMNLRCNRLSASAVLFLVTEVDKSNMSGSAVLNGLEKQTPGDVTPRNDDSVKVPRTIEEYMSMNSLVQFLCDFL
jgi:hypothetical protein